MRLLAFLIFLLAAVPTFAQAPMSSRQGGTGNNNSGATPGNIPLFGTGGAIGDTSDGFNISNNVMTPPADSSGKSILFPGVWSPQIHQNKGGQSQGHSYAATDQDWLIVQDHATQVTADASVLWGIGFNVGASGNIIGPQLTIGGTTYNLFLTVGAGETNPQFAHDIGANINGGIISATLANPGSGLVNGTNTYPLSIPTLPGAGGICYRVPAMIAVVSGGSIASFTLTDPNRIAGGVCPNQITNPVAVTGTNATINVVQGNYQFVAAMAAVTDVNGFGYQPNASQAASTVVTFDFPRIAGTYVAVCAATVTKLPMGTSCPSPNTGSIIGGSLGTGLDIGPYISLNRTNPGQNPVPGDNIDLLDFVGDQSATCAQCVNYAGINTQVGAMATGNVLTGASSGNTIVLTTSSTGIYNGLLVYDTSAPQAIPAGTTVTISGFTLTLSGAGIQPPGVAANDTLEFLDPAIPLGNLILGAANSASNGNFAGTQLEVCGGPAKCSGYNAGLFLPQHGQTTFGVENGISGTNVASAFQLGTLTFGSSVQWGLKDNNGAPTAYMLTGSSTEEVDAYSAFAPGLITATLSGSSVASLAITTAGSRYLNGTYALGFSGGGCSPEPTGTYTASAGAISATNLLTGGTGCTSAPNVLAPAGQFIWGYFGLSANPWATLNIGGLTLGVPFGFSGTAPTVSACGTSPSIDASATNSSGKVTVGSVAAASCTITFATPAFQSWNHCRVTPESAIATFGYTYTLTALTVTATSLVGGVLDYECDGR
jgi:hypothetical protein